MKKISPPLTPMLFEASCVADLALAKDATQPTSGLSALLNKDCSGYAFLLVHNVRAYRQGELYRLSDLQSSFLVQESRVTKEKFRVPANARYALVAYHHTKGIHSLEVIIPKNEAGSADYWTSSRLFGVTFKGPFSPS